MLNNILQNFTIVNLVSWAVFGLVIGLIAHLVDPEDVRGGVVGTVITGILGALIGGFLASLFLGLSLNVINIQSILIALAGALILSFAERLLFRKSEHIKTPKGRVL